MKNSNILIIQSSSHHIDWTRSIVLGLAMAVFISFINLFLEPFKTAESSKLLVLGYSACFLISYLIAFALEYYLFKKLQPIWANRTLAFFVTLFILSATTIYGYDVLVIKSLPFTWDGFIPYTLRIVVPFALLVIPMIYLGRTAQISITQGDEAASSKEIVLKGASTGDVLHTTSDRLLYAKSENNYCDIFYLDAAGNVRHKLFRIKISELVSEVTCLTRCHRGFAINLDNVAYIHPSKTKATVQLKWSNEKIPVSKSYLTSLPMLESSTTKTS